MDLVQNIEKVKQDLIDIAREICSRYGVLCLEAAGETDYEKLIIFSLTWIENFFYIDPLTCGKDQACIEKIFDMHREVLEYALRGEYIVDLNKEKFLESVKRLLGISSV